MHGRKHAHTQRGWDGFFCSTFPKIFEDNLILESSFFNERMHYCHQIDSVRALEEILATDFNRRISTTELIFTTTTRLLKENAVSCMRYL